MLKKHVINIIIILIITIILELTIFNINSYRVLSSKNKKTFSDKDYRYLQEEDANYAMVEISNINEEIKTLHIEIENYDNVEYQFFYTDETTDSLCAVPSKTYIGDLKNSKYIATYLSRNK